MELKDRTYYIKSLPMGKEDKSKDVTPKDLFLGIALQALVVLIAWCFISVLPMPCYHKHSDECYLDGVAVCGKEEDELVFKRGSLRSPFELFMESEECE